MPIPDNVDQERLAEAALAILWLTAHGDRESIRVWKGLDWDLMNLLHEKGWIGNPVGKQKSVVLTEEGAEVAARSLEKHFGLAPK